MSRMMLYFEITRASYGATSWAYLESLPYSKLHYLYKASQIVEIHSSLDLITNVNAAFAGNKKYINSLRNRLRELSWEPPKTDVGKLTQIKQKFRGKYREAKKKLKGKKRKG